MKKTRVLDGSRIFLGKKIIKKYGNKFTIKNEENRVILTPVKKPTSPKQKPLNNNN